MSVTTITVTGPVKTAAGANASGTVTFRLKERLISAGQLVGSPVPVVATLASGTFSQVLYATNDPTTSNTNLTYEVTEDITGAHKPYKYDVELDYATAGGTVKLCDLVEVEPGPAVASYLSPAALNAATEDAYAALAVNLDALITGAITRDANDAPTSAAVIWPDGTTGTYTATVVSVDFPGAIDAYTITYGSPATRTYTQPTVTRNANGAVTTRPAIVVT